MLFRFVLYGLLGWGLEILWTGINSVRNGDRTLRGTSSLWMFPIYGMGVLLEPIINLLTMLPWAIRGALHFYSGVCLRTHFKKIFRLSVGLQFKRIFYTGRYQA